MFQLPGEDERVASIQSQLAAEFGFADDLCQTWYNAPWDRWFGRLPVSVRNVGIRLTAQAFRQFRSVVAECRRGEAHCAGILCRGLFESTVAIAFILASDLPLELEQLFDKDKPRKTDKGVLKKRVRAPAPGSPATNLSRDFRADLYRAFDAFCDHRFYREMAKVEGIGDEYTRTDDNSMFGITRGIQDEHERIIGSEWFWALKEAGTYSGLTFAETTAIVCPHLVSVRNTVYRPLCQDAHAAGAMKHNDWFSSRDEIYGVLRLAFMVALRCLYFLGKYLAIDEPGAIPVDGWLTRFQSMAPPISA